MMSEDIAQQMAEFKVWDSGRKRSENIQATSLNDLIMRGTYKYKTERVRHPSKSFSL